MAWTRREKRFSFPAAVEVLREQPTQRRADECGLLRSALAAPQSKQHKSELTPSSSRRQFLCPLMTHVLEPWAGGPPRGFPGAPDGCLSAAPVSWASPGPHVVRRACNARGGELGGSFSLLLKNFKATLLQLLRLGAVSAAHWTSTLEGGAPRPLGAPVALQGRYGPPYRGCCPRKSEVLKDKGGKHASLCSSENLSRASPMRVVGLSSRRHAQVMPTSQTAVAFLLCVLRVAAAPEAAHLLLPAWASSLLGPYAAASLLPSCLYSGPDVRDSLVGAVRVSHRQPAGGGREGGVAPQGVTRWAHGLTSPTNRLGPSHKCCFVSSYTALPGKPSHLLPSCAAAEPRNADTKAGGCGAADAAAIAAGDAAADAAAAAARAAQAARNAAAAALLTPSSGPSRSPPVVEADLPWDRVLGRQYPSYQDEATKLPPRGLESLPVKDVPEGAPPAVPSSLGGGAAGVGALGRGAPLWNALGQDQTELERAADTERQFVEERWMRRLAEVHRLSDQHYDAEATQDQVLTSELAFDEALGSIQELPLISSSGSGSSSEQSSTSGRRSSTRLSRRSADASEHGKASARPHTTSCFTYGPSRSGFRLKQITPPIAHRQGLASFFYFHSPHSAPFVPFINACRRESFGLPRPAITALKIENLDSYVDAPANKPPPPSYAPQLQQQAQQGQQQQQERQGQGLQKGISPSACLSRLPVEVGMCVVGMREDVEDLVENLRKIVFRRRQGKGRHTSNSFVKAGGGAAEKGSFENPWVASLSIKGPIAAVAGDLVLPEELEIVNKSQYLCFMNSNYYLNLKVKIEEIEEFVLPEFGYESLNRDIDAEGFFYFASYCSPVPVFGFEAQRVPEAFLEAPDPRAHGSTVHTFNITSFEQLQQQRFGRSLEDDPVLQACGHCLPKQAAAGEETHQARGGKQMAGSLTQQSEADGRKQYEEQQQRQLKPQEAQQQQQQASGLPQFPFESLGEVVTIELHTDGSATPRQAFLETLGRVEELAASACRALVKNCKESRDGSVEEEFEDPDMYQDKHRQARSKASNQCLPTGPSNRGAGRGKVSKLLAAAAGGGAVVVVVVVVAAAAAAAGLTVAAATAAAAAAAPGRQPGGRAEPLPWYIGVPWNRYKNSLARTVERHKTFFSKDMLRQYSPVKEQLLARREQFGVEADPARASPAASEHQQQHEEPQQQQEVRETSDAEERWLDEEELEEDLVQRSPTIRLEREREYQATLKLVEDIEAAKAVQERGDGEGLPKFPIKHKGLEDPPDWVFEDFMAQRVPIGMGWGFTND
ncbi:hypothetical protein ACSSS7_004292 [Eimeria intestinalis]